MTQDARPEGDRITVYLLDDHEIVRRGIAQLVDTEPDLTVIGEETQHPYDRVHLSDWFGHRRAEMLALDTGVWADPRITLVTGDAAESVDRSAHTVTCASGTVHEYDRLVLATGSTPVLPPTPGLLDAILEEDGHLVSRSRFLSEPRLTQRLDSRQT